MAYVGYAGADSIPAERIVRPSRLRTLATAVARELRHLPDQLLHSRRRARALASLAKRSPHSVLFVCHGNVCRSPFAAAALSSSLETVDSELMAIGSAGFIGPDRSPPPEALAAARRLGQEISTHRSRLVTSENLRAADLIVVMAPNQARGIRNRVRETPTQVVVLGDLDPLPIRRRTILDPWSGSATEFDLSYGRISRCVAELVRVMKVAG